MPEPCLNPEAAYGQAGEFDLPKVLLADSDPIFLTGLHLSLAKQFVVAGEVTTSAECLNLAQRAQILIMGFSLACGRSAFGLLPELRLRYSELAVIVLLSPTAGWMTSRLHAAGARGILSRRTAPHAMPGLVRDAILGSPLPPVTHQLPREASTAGSVDVSVLSARELEIFRLIGLGKGGKDITSLLGISGKTVSAHRENIKAKLGLRTAWRLSSVAISYANWEATGADYMK